MTTRNDTRNDTRNGDVNFGVEIVWIFDGDFVRRLPINMTSKNSRRIHAEIHVEIHAEIQTEIRGFKRRIRGEFTPNRVQEKIIHRIDGFGWHIPWAKPYTMVISCVHTCQKTKNTAKIKSEIENMFLKSTGNPRW